VVAETNHIGKIKKRGKYSIQFSWSDDLSALLDMKVSLVRLILGFICESFACRKVMEMQLSMKKAFHD
jgi:hypothetical protein